MSFKRSVFFSLGRPAPKPVPLDVIGRIGYNYIVPEEKSEEEATKELPGATSGSTTAQQTDINKLTQAISDAIGNAVKQNTPTDPTDGQQNSPPDDGQQNNNLVNPESGETPQVPVINDDKIVVEPDSPTYDESISSGGDALKELDPVLYNAIQKTDKRGATFIREDRIGGKNEHPLKGRLVVLKRPVTNDSITYVVHSTTSRPSGKEVKDFAEFKQLLLARNIAALDGNYTGNKSVSGFIDKHSK